MVKKKYRMHSPPHPGELLKEELIEPMNLTITEVAKGLGFSRNTVSEFINGHNGVSADMAMRLSEAFNTSPEFWLNMQNTYDLWMTSQKENSPKVRRFYEEVH
jgi:addiction module HigA family antidote